MTTQDRLLWLKPRSVWMCGRAMFTIVPSSTIMSCAPPMMARARPRPRGAGAAGSWSGGDAVEAVVVDMASGPFGSRFTGYGRLRAAAGAAGSWPRVARAAGRTTLSSTWATRSGVAWMSKTNMSWTQMAGQQCWPAGAGRRPRRPLRVPWPARMRRAPGRAWAGRSAAGTRRTARRRGASPGRGRRARRGSRRTGLRGRTPGRAGRARRLPVSSSSARGSGPASWPATASSTRSALVGQRR